MCSGNMTLVILYIRGSIAILTWQRHIIGNWDALMYRKATSKIVCGFLRDCIIDIQLLHSQGQGNPALETSAGLVI